MGRVIVPLMGSLIATSVSAQIIPDATLPINSQVAPGCTVCTINGGTVRGVNLFHSFREFSIPTGGTAWFNNSVPIQNILTRVTGNSISNIDGLIRTNGTANLFLLNPNGIVFGQNARLQIGGSFVASTANSFKFPDGSEFSATNPQAPPLLAINVPIGLQSGAVSSGTITNRGNLTAGQDLILEATQLDLQGQLVAGRDLTLKAQDTVQIRDTATVPFLAQSGRDLTIQGDRAIDILALNHAGQVPLQSGSNLSLLSDGIISGDARFASGGSFQVRSVSGGAAQFRSLYDPIISSAGDVEIVGSYNGAALLVESLGSVRFNGSVNITSNDATFSPLDPDPDLARLGSSNAFIVRAGRSSLLYAPSGLPTTVNGATFQPGAIGTGITVTGDINTNGGPVILDTTTGNIRVNSILPFSFPGTAGSVELSTGNGNIDVAGAILSFGLSNGSGGLVSLTTGNGNVTIAGELLTFALDNGGSGGSGGDVRITTQNGNILLANELNTFSLKNGSGGNVTLLSANGSITTNKINAFSISGGNAGAVQITAGDRSDSPSLGNISTDLINGFAVGGSGGKITLATNNGDVQPGELLTNSYGGGNAADVTISTTNGNIRLAPESDIQAIASSGAGGNISLSTTNGTISTGTLFSYSDGIGAGGRVSVATTKGDVTVRSIITYSSGAESGGAITLANTDGNIATDFLVSRSQTGRAGDITLTSTQGNLSTTGNGYFAFSAEGQGGDIRLNAGGNIDTGSLNSSGKLGSGNITAIAGGDFLMRIREVDASVSQDLASPVISSDTFGMGRGGDIYIQGQSVLGRDGAQISASTHSTGSGGNVSVRAFDRVELVGTTPLGARPSFYGPGGIVGVPTGEYFGGYLPTGNAKDITSLTLPSASFPTGIFTQTTTASSGNAGSITVETPRLLVQNGAAIAATTFGQGNGGNIRLNADAITLSNGSVLGGVAAGSAGGSGVIDIQTQTLSVTAAGLIQTQTLGRGSAGAIQINATDKVTLADAGSAIRSGSGDRQNMGSQIGEGGSLQIKAPTVEIRDRAVLSAETYTASRGGSIFVNVDQFNADTGAQLRTTTFNSGQAGNIFVTAANQFTLTNPETGLFANTVAGSTGSGGSIFVNTETALIRQDAGIAVDSLGTGQGGNIQIKANRVTLTDRGFLTAETASAQGGNINLDIQDMLLLRRNSLISATAGTAQGGGDGGNVDIKALFIVGILGENSDIRANAFTGNGGKVNITAQGIFGLKFQSKLTPFSDITASSQFGTSGTVTLNLPNIDPNRGLVALPLNLVDPSNQINQGCSAIAQARQKSRFVALGRGGLPTNPEHNFEGSQVLVNLIEPREINGQRAVNGKQAMNADPRHASPASSIVEAQGVAIAPIGVISLITQAQTAVPHSNWQTSVECLGNPDKLESSQ